MPPKTPAAAPPKLAVRSAYLLLALPPLFWAANTVVGHLAVETMSPYALSFWRAVIALIILLPFSIAAVKVELPLIRRHWKMLVVMGALSVGAFNTVLYAALQTTALNAALVGSSMPLLIMVLSRFWLGEPFTRGRAS